MAAHLRPATPSDAEQIAAVYAPYVTDTAISFESDPPTAEQVQERMLAEPRLPWLVAESAGAVVGYAYAAPHHARAAYRWSVNVSVYLAASAQRQGTGRALYGALLDRARDLGYVRAFAGITLPNPGSVGLHEALGFTPVGVYRAAGFKHGRWHDVGWWQLGLSDPVADPPEPAAWGQE